MMGTKVIGLTGGIGSGKTTIAKYFESLGVPVYIADDEAKKILFTPDAVKDITAAFGTDVLTDGVPDKAKIASLVFNDREKLELLNSIIHPKVKQHFAQWLEHHKNEKFVIREAAILFESGSYKDCYKIITVTAPAEIKISRIITRDKTTEEEVLKRMASQWDDARKIELSDFIINNVDLQEARKQAYTIYTILNKIKESFDC